MYGRPSTFRRKRYVLPLYVKVTVPVASSTDLSVQYICAAKYSFFINTSHEPLGRNGKTSRAAP